MSKCFGMSVKTVVIAGLLTVLSLLVDTFAQDAKDIGSLYQCAHDLRGKVWVKNDREITIQGFNYDGKGPAAWFHGQLRPANGISTSDANRYVTLPYPDTSCKRLQVGREYRDENVTLILPRSIKEFQTIGVFCYQYCHNFGHIIIPDNLDVPAAPPNHLAVQECEKPDYKSCSSPRNGALKPDCTAGANQLKFMNNGLAFIFAWCTLSVFLKASMI